MNLQFLQLFLGALLIIFVLYKLVDLLGLKIDTIKNLKGRAIYLRALLGLILVSLASIGFWNMLPDSRGGVTDYQFYSDVYFFTNKKVTKMIDGLGDTKFIYGDWKKIEEAIYTIDFNSNYDPYYGKYDINVVNRLARDHSANDENRNTVLMDREDTIGIASRIAFIGYVKHNETALLHESAGQNIPQQ